MAAELDLITAARHHQDDLLAEAANRRLLRVSRPVQPEPIQSGRRIQTLLRRIAGAPTFA
jgi:hypothetical protein